MKIVLFCLLVTSLFASEKILIVNEDDGVIKKEKKKKKKNKFIKKRDAKYPYTRYLKKLSNKKGIGKFDYKYRFGAQLSYDTGYIYEANNNYFRSLWRRVRVYHKGSFFNEKLFYELEYSFTGENNHKDIFVGYQNKIRSIKTNYRFKLGNIKIPFSLDRYSSSKNIMFMERALSDSFSEGRKLGAELLFSTKLPKSRFNFFSSVFTNSIDEKLEDEVDQPGYSFRATYAYKFDKRHLFSFGTAYMGQDMKGENVRFNQASESELIEEKYVSVRIKDVNTVNKNNIEALYINNKFTIQGEYTQTAVDALVNDYSFNGYYMQGSYFLLGNGRKYKMRDATLAKVKPNKDGALELALRYSYVNLNDKDEHGGIQSDYTYGANWYINHEVKLMANYIVAHPEGTDDYDGRLQIFQLRLLVAF